MCPVGGHEQRKPGHSSVLACDFLKLSVGLNDRNRSSILSKPSWNCTKRSAMLKTMESLKVPSVVNGTFLRVSFGVFLSSFFLILTFPRVFYDCLIGSLGTPIFPIPFPWSFCFFFIFNFQKLFKMWLYLNTCFVDIFMCFEFCLEKC